MDAHDTYLGHIDMPYGRAYANAVGRFQEGFLRDKVCKDVDDAFEKAVKTCESLIPVFKLQSAK